MAIELSKDYERALDAIVDDIFEKATYEKDWTWGTLAKQAGLSVSTVHNLGSRITRLPQLRTVYQLGRAVGMDSLRIDRRLKVRKAA